EYVVRGADARRNIPIGVNAVRPLERNRRGVEMRGGLRAVALRGTEARRLIVADRPLHAETIPRPGVLAVKRVGNRPIGRLPLRKAPRNLVSRPVLEAVGEERRVAME